MRDHLRHPVRRLLDADVAGLDAPGRRPADGEPVRARRATLALDPVVLERRQPGLPGPVRIGVASGTS